MTMKHVGFEHSEIMRSFERVAQEKGLVQPDSVESKLHKLASAKIESSRADLTTSDDVNQNLLKLCSGLRSKGLGKYAQSIEDKMMQVRAAEADLYNTQKETGESLLEEAHPEGSVEVAEAEDDNGVVQTRSDIHKAVEEIAMKEPTAKLAREAVMAQLKVALGQAAIMEGKRHVSVKATALLGTLQAAHSKMLEVFVEDDDGVLGQFGKNLLGGSLTGWTKTFKRDATTKLNNLMSAVSNLDKGSPGVAINAIKNSAKEYVGFLSSKSEAAAVAADCKKFANEIISVCDQGFEMMLKSDSEVKHESALTNHQGGPASKLAQRFAGLLSTVALYKSRLAARRHPKAAEYAAWLDRMAAFIAQEQHEFGSALPEHQGELVGDYDVRLNQIQAKLNNFKAKVLP